MHLEIYKNGGDEYGDELDENEFIPIKQRTTSKKRTSVQ
jgi:hypothetical protein